jgi:hypothetical protein
MPGLLAAGDEYHVHDYYLPCRTHALIRRIPAVSKISLFYTRCHTFHTYQWGDNYHHVQSPHSALP